MSGTDRHRTNQKLRTLINKYILGYQPGTTIHTYTVAKAFSTKNRCLTPHRVAMFLRERVDLKHEGVNEWVVIG